MKLTKSPIMQKSWILLMLAITLMSADACNRKSSEATESSRDAASTTTASGESSSGTVTVGGTEYREGEYLALAPEIGANVQGAFNKQRAVNGGAFYRAGSQLNELGINMTRGLSGTGATYSRYGDASKNPLYKGMGWGKSAQDYPSHKRPAKIMKRDTREANNFYDDWIDFAKTTGMKEMIVVANMYMPFSELEAFLNKAEANGIKILWLEAENEVNSKEHQEGLYELLKAKDSRATSYSREVVAEKAFGLYWDWAEELESFAARRGIPVSVVGTPPAYAFTEMLDPKTMGDKANLSPAKAKSDKFFNQMGSDRARRGSLKAEAVSRHRYRQYDLIRGQVNARNEVLRKKLEYPIYRNYFSDLKKTEVDFYRKLYPDAKILFTEWGIRKPEAGAGNSFAVAVDVAKFLIANCQINAEYGFNVVEAVTYQSMYGNKMGGLVYHDNNRAIKLSVEGKSMSMFSQLSGRPVLEIGDGDNTKTQWIRVACEDGQKLFYYNLGNSAMDVPYTGTVEYLESTDLLSENTNTARKNGVNKLPPHSIGVMTIQ